MTKSSFSSTDKDDASMFQKYPIFWWTNYIVITILVASGILYFFVSNDMIKWVEKICTEIPELVCLVSVGILFIIIVQVGRMLQNVCKNDK